MNKRGAITQIQVVAIILALALLIFVLIMYFKFSLSRLGVIDRIVDFFRFGG